VAGSLKKVAKGGVSGRRTAKRKLDEYLAEHEKVGSRIERCVDEIHELRDERAYLDAKMSALEARLVSLLAKRDAGDDDADLE
jgi:ubiquinone biosynthesis protein UbiJ